MFELNPNLEIQQEWIEDSPIYIIDDFYAHPQEVYAYITAELPPVWKQEDILENRSYNTVHFEDRRHVTLETPEVGPVYEFLANLCQQDYPTHHIVTNFTRFFKSDFNDYKNNYWWPHLDCGYNGIVYFNTSCGTNIYENLDPEHEPPTPEHLHPWRPKAKYRLLKTLEPKFNRLVLFDGGRYYHGMDVCNEDYFGNAPDAPDAPDASDAPFRINQVFFLESTWPKFHQGSNIYMKHKCHIAT